MQAKEYDMITDNLVSLFPLFRRFLKVSEGDRHNNMLNPQYPILGILSKRGPLSMSELGMHLGISKPNMTVLIDNLIKEKEVKRTYDENDRRIIIIEVTEKGRNTLKEAKEALKQGLKEKLLALDDKDIKKLSDSLTGMKDMLSKIDQKREAMEERR